MRGPTVALSIALLLFACSTGEESTLPLGDPTIADLPAKEAPTFVEVAAEVGLDFVHFNGMSGELYFNEMMGGGVALIDYDNDGDLDAFLVQGSMLGDDIATTEARFPPPPGTLLTDRLYRNELIHDGSSGPLRFTDVTVESGISGSAYSMGVATGDIDNDGWTDIYITNYGSNQLLRNTGNGTFEDVTARAGVDDPRWSVAATFFDFDRDGWLDLFVGNYVEFSLAAHAPCPLASGAMTYCGPGTYPPQPNSLFRNRGDGTFEDVSVPAGLRIQSESTLGAIAGDFDGDGWADLYVANDLMSNNLWINQGDGRFRDQALLAGVAVNRDGQPEASMGLDADDFDADGDLDLILTHLDQETNTLYVNDGSGLFEDASVRSGLGPPSLNYTGFGTAWLDFDNDGWLDLLTVNGAVVGVEALIRAGDDFPLHQRNQLFRNLGSGQFAEVTAEAALADSEVSRGAAFGDLDNDGDTDAIIVNNSGPVRLLLNRAGDRSYWLGLRAATEGRDALGASIHIEYPDGRRSMRRIHTDGSYAAASDPRISVGLGNEPAIGRIQVRWPDGTSETWADLEAGRYFVLRQGEGTPAGGD